MPASETLRPLPKPEPAARSRSPLETFLDPLGRSDFAKRADTRFPDAAVHDGPPVATITPQPPGTASTPVPARFRRDCAAIGLAERDPCIKVIVLRGAAAPSPAVTTSAAASSIGAMP